MLDTYGVCMYNDSMKKSERKTTLRLTDEAKELIELLSQKLGINKTAVIELAVRKLAEKEKVK